MNSNLKATNECGENVKELDNLPKDLPSEILDQPMEKEKERANQNGNLPDVTENELELENEKEIQTPEIEKDQRDNSSQNKTSERVEQSKDTKQRQSTEMDNTEQGASSVDLAEDDTPDHQTADQTRRSERLRKPPAKFTYPQLGKPLISFAQTILDGFNKALLETFEGAPTLVRT